MSYGGKISPVSADAEGVVSLAEPGETGKSSFLPSSTTLWVGIGYVALYLIRPWEEIFPWLQVLRLERSWAIVFIACVLTDKKCRFRLDLNTLVLVLLLALIGTSVLLSENGSLSREAYRNFLIVIVISILLKATVSTPYKLLTFVSAIIFIQTAYLTKTLWEFFVNGQHRYDMGVVRIFGIETTFGGPNNLAMTIVSMMPLALFLWETKNYFTVCWPKKWKNRYTFLIIYYTLLAILTLILTNSRSGMLCFVIFIVYLGIKSNPLRSRLSRLALCAFIMAIIWISIPAESQTRIQTIWNPEVGPQNAQVSAQGRIEGLSAGFAMFKQKPLYGVGLGNFIPHRVERVDGMPLEAHNLIGQTLGETGALGTAGFLFFLIVTLGDCRALEKTGKKLGGAIGQVYSSFSRAAASTICLLLILGMFGHNLCRYNWYWTSALAASALFMARETLKRERHGYRRSHFAAQRLDAEGAR